MSNQRADEQDGQMFFRSVPTVSGVVSLRREWIIPRAHPENR
jgi:hypothetical protein